MVRLHLKSDVNLNLAEEHTCNSVVNLPIFFPLSSLVGKEQNFMDIHLWFMLIMLIILLITGKGTIDAQGELEFAAWSKIKANDRDRLRKMGDKLVPVHERIFGESTVLRPSCIQPYGYRHVSSYRELLLKILLFGQSILYIVTMW